MNLPAYSPHTLVAASILAADHAHLASEVVNAHIAGADWIHIDVMDGHFVPPISFGPLVVKALHNLTPCPLDVHLMVANPAHHVPQFAEAGADIITVHFEADNHIYQTLQLIKSLGKKTGLAINPGTNVHVVKPLLHLLDIVLVMTVNPGFGGQKFLHEQCLKINTLSEWILNSSSKTLISVDGGISPKTAPLVTQAGAHVLVAGTEFFKKTPASYPDNAQALRHHPS